MFYIDPLTWIERGGGLRRVNYPVFPYHIGYFSAEVTCILIAKQVASREPVPGLLAKRRVP